MYLWFQRGAAWASKKGWKNALGLDRRDVQKITLIRHGAIGDQVLTRVFINEAREFFPNAKITLSLINTASYGAPIDLVDEVHVVEKTRNGKRTTYLERFKQIKSLGEQDIIFDLAATSMAKWICLLNKASLKIGFPYREIDRYLYDIVVKRSDLVLETETMLHQLCILGAKTSRPLNYGYPKYQTDEASPYILYFTSASNDGKKWPEKRFVELGRKMAARLPSYRHVFLDGVNPNEKVDGIVELLADLGNVERQEVLPYEEVMEYLGKASMVISNDTGVRNMAISVNTPTVGIFFNTIPFRYWPRDGLHEIAFGEDHTLPDPDDVMKIAIEHLNRVKEYK
ncbi:MAG: glycosyltransferase family 9 protein [Sulfuricurvum sp.]|nr:glycosyltransferase family 9 protein [Sulfuricurvum sp.]